MSNGMAFLLALILGGGIFGWWYTSEYQAYQEQIASLEESIQELKRKIASAKDVEREVEEYEAEIKKKQQELEKLKKELPSKLELDVLINKLEYLCLKHGMNLHDIRFGNLTRFEGYSEMQIDISVDGPFMGKDVEDDRGLLKLLKDLEKDKYFNTDVGMVNVTGKSEVGAKKVEVSASISMKTYVVEE